LVRAAQHGWFPGARYTNLRTIKKFRRIGFLDIDWKRYCFQTHLNALIKTRPVLTVARDVVSLRDLDKVKSEVDEILKYASYAILVPKDRRFERAHVENLSDRVILGYSVPTGYGGTELPVDFFEGPVHLLGGNPLSQRQLGEVMNVISFDNNNITIAARFGKYFDGKSQKVHSSRGRFYEDCIFDSMLCINKLWSDYRPAPDDGFRQKFHRLLLSTIGDC
jgi:hypothetical protein